jgi:hypothetical protein
LAKCSDAVEFATRLAGFRLTSTDRAAAVLWFSTDYCEKPAATIQDIASAIEGAGYGQQNRTRLSQQFSSDRRITGNRTSGYRIHAGRLDEFRAQFEPIAGVKPVPLVDTVLPLEVFACARGYIYKTAAQLNAAYEYSLFDCCAVMARRLLETLIIEAYEQAGREQDLKGPDGNFMMFSGLLAKIDGDPSVLGLSRNARGGLTAFKRLGDLSAHNRRFNAVQDDIDRVRDGIRVSVEELLHLAGQHPSDSATA